MIAGAESERQRERVEKAEEREGRKRAERESETERVLLSGCETFFFGICQAGHLAGLGETSQKAGQVAPGQKL